jgi:hypothetical protein
MVPGSSRLRSCRGSNVAFHALVVAFHAFVVAFHALVVAFHALVVALAGGWVPSRVLERSETVLDLADQNVRITDQEAAKIVGI